MAVPCTAKLTDVSTVGAWLAEMVNDAAPPSVMADVLADSVNVGRTAETIVTDALLDGPTWYA
jgi:hypothetical protein